jgi:4-amino-4-deoxy-L-arabinose transferase-like glycosyltransferase
MNEISGNREMPLKGRLTIVGILLISIMGSSGIFYATQWGPWVFSDSTEYIVSARNLIAGHGLGLYGPTGAFHPLSLHPPFYSLVLSFIGLFGADLVTTARWIDIILFGLTILLAGIFISAYTESSWLSVIGAILLFSMPALVDVFSGAMSEPLFIIIGLASLFLILLFLKNNRHILLLLAGIASGLSMITRYSGLAFIFTGVFVLLVFPHKPWKKRITDIIPYVILSCLPTIGWLTWLKLQAFGARSFTINVNFWEQFIKFRLSVMEIFWSWLPFTSLIPRYTYNLARNFLIIFILLLLVLFCLTVWKMHKNHQKVFNPTTGLVLGFVMIIFTIAYLFILAFSYIYTYPPPDLIDRTLLPVHIAVLVSIFSLVLFFIRPWQSAKWLNIIPIFLAIGISISYLHDSVDIVSQYHQSGAGYTSRDWQASTTIRMVEQLPPNIPLISNESAAVLFYTGRPAYDISEIVDHEPQSLTSRFGDDPNDPAQKAFRENGAALVLFTSGLLQLQQLYGDQAILRWKNLTRGLSLYAQTGDGAIYFYPSTGQP